MFCRFCGKQVPEDSTFCPHCGKKMITNIEYTGGWADPNMYADPVPQQAHIPQAPVYTYPVTQKKKSKWWIWVLFVLFLVGSCSALASDTDEPRTQVNSQSRASMKETFISDFCETTTLSKEAANKVYSLLTDDLHFESVEFSKKNKKQNTPISISWKIEADGYEVIVTADNDGIYDAFIQDLIRFVDDGKIVATKEDIAQAKQSKAEGNESSRNDFYSEGMYKVGSDIPAGEYIVFATKTVGGYICVNSDSSGKFDSIVCNENFATFTYITVDDGQYLTVDRGEFASADDYQPNGLMDDGYYTEGMYKVGRDIPAGEYYVTATKNVGCYVEVSPNSRHELSDIISNENTKTSLYITVEEGQYLTVTRGKFKPA